MRKTKLINPHPDRLSVPESSGFTLIELMVVVAIVAVLAALALPSYRSYVVKTYRSVAQSQLAEVASRQEGRFVDRKTYTTNLTKLGYPANPYYIESDGKAQAAITEDSKYKIELRSTSAAAFTVAAVPVQGQTSDTECKTLTLTHTGVKGVADGATASADDCW